MNKYFYDEFNSDTNIKASKEINCDLCEYYRFIGHGLYACDVDRCPYQID